MKHIVKQFPRDLDACTQFSIAMAYDIPLEEVAVELGWNAVSTKELRQYLVRKGLSATGDSRRDAGAITEGKGIAIIHGASVGHAVAFEDGIIYDSNGHLFDSLHDLTEHYTFHTGETWVFYTAFHAEPIKYREFEVGGRKHAEV